VERPAINRDEGSTLAFSKPQARKLLDAPAEDTIAGLRDRAILSVGLQVGLRRAEIAALKVGDLHQNRGYDALKVMRKGADNPIDVTLVRDNIRVRSVRARVEGDDIGYIRITTFNEQTTEGLKKEINNLNTQLGDKLKGFVIDLRNNPGGLLEEAVTVSDTFLERGEIVSTRGRNAEETQRRSARPGDLTKGKPVIVLINGGSASASEIVAGALQDHKRATLIGTRSFGKGSVQTIIPLGAGNGALRLTTARYYTPSGKSIQAKGIVPDIEVLQDVPDELKSRTDTKGEASLKGHLKNGDDEKTGSQAYVPPDAKNDKQLIAAVDLLHGVKKAADLATPDKPAPAAATTTAPTDAGKDPAAPAAAPAAPAAPSADPAKPD